MSLYKIDDVAKECGLTKRTIRYYEEIGVMPSPQRTDGGTRLYTREDIDYLKRSSVPRKCLASLRNCIRISQWLMC